MNDPTLDANQPCGPRLPDTNDSDHDASLIPGFSARSNQQNWREFRRRLRSLSPHTDLLHELMGFGHFAEMAMTRDGLLIGRVRRSDGFDAFIGHPTRAMLDRNARLWKELSHHERCMVLNRLQELSIRPERVGLPPICDHRCDVNLNGKVTDHRRF